MVRKTYRELTYKLREELKNYLEDSDLADVIVEVEAMLWGFKKLPGNGNAFEAWSVIPGFDQPILPGQADLSISSRMRILFSFLRSESVWHAQLEKYQRIERIYRCFIIEEDGSYYQTEPRFVTNRGEKYEKLLTQPVERKKNSMQYAAPGEFKYRRRVDDKITDFSGNMPEYNVNTIQQLPGYNQKKTLSLSKSFNWLELAKEMDAIEDGKNNWQSTARHINLLPVKSQNTLYYYAYLNHIAGGLGAGKSRFMMMETYRLVKHLNARVGLIEGSVSQVLKRVFYLKRLGIKAVPIIGKSMRDYHLDNYLYAHKDEIVDIASCITEKHEAIKHLSGKCLVKALAQDYEENNFYPCSSLYQNISRVKCPLVQQCGVYQDAYELKDADVWVATPASVLKTKLSENIDPYGRNIFEAMYDLLDVIFIDEADEVQRIFDETFMSEYDLFGSSDHVFERLERQVSEKTNGRYNDIAPNSVLFIFRQHLANLTTTIWRIYHKLSKSLYLRKNLQNKKVFHIYGLAFDLAAELSGNENKEERRLSLLFKQYIKNPIQTKVLSETANILLRPTPTEPEIEVIKQCIVGINGKISNRSDAQLIYDQVEFFLYLARIEYHMYYLLNYFNLVQAELGIESDLSTMFSLRKDYLPFLKEGMTGMVFGYRYEVNEDSPLGRFKFFEYTGIGRILLKDWCKLYEDADNKKGPGVVMLSGTSYAPGSHHYHLDVTVDWLITSGKKHPQVEQSFYPVLSKESGKYLYISGITDKNQRGSELVQMVNQCKYKIERELMFWEKQRRRVLLVVNSYEDLESVIDAFKNDNNWKGRFKVLSRENHSDEIYYPLSRIENFSKEKAEVLAVPLSAVNRGYNILDNELGALFGSAFFLIRPYPVPNNMRYMIQILHAYLPYFMEQISNESLTFKKGIRKLRSESFKQLEKMIRKPDYWAILSNKEREIIGWFTLIPVWQMIGRLLRGDRDARVFYVDVKFNKKPENQSHIPSMLEFWGKLMREEKDNIIFQELYGPFMNSIGSVTEEVKYNE